LLQAAPLPQNKLLEKVPWATPYFWYFYCSKPLLSIGTTPLHAKHNCIEIPGDCGYFAAYSLLSTSLYFF
jgi:hypothetical protein